jgi:hypothetical protein
LALYPYGTGNPRLAFGGLFSGQFLLVIPEYDIVIVVNAWNILRARAWGREWRSTACWRQ